MQVSESSQWLRSRTSKEQRPFQEETITAYKVAARALGAWMASRDMDGDFTACDAGVLNRFFRDYRAGHSQGGTNTKQRNLRHLFTWLEDQYDHPPPYAQGRASRGVRAAGAALPRHHPGPCRPTCGRRRYHRQAGSPWVWLGLLAFRPDSPGDGLALASPGRRELTLIAYGRVPLVRREEMEWLIRRTRTG
ncbi:MAG TPA: hypothetical protein VH478_13455 [Trebonia sp.]|nr:hypothetical protein [Trebonia sp.]